MLDLMCADIELRVAARGLLNERIFYTRDVMMVVEQRQAVVVLS